MEHITFKNLFLFLIIIFGGYCLLRLASYAIANSWFQAKSKFEQVNGNSKKEAKNGEEEKT